MQDLDIKDHKLYLKPDRTSCHKFEANQFRLFLHSAACVFVHTFKTRILRGTPFAGAGFETVRARLFKTGARVRELKTGIKTELPPSFPLKNLLARNFLIFEHLRFSGQISKDYNHTVLQKFKQITGKVGSDAGGPVIPVSFHEEKPENRISDRCRPRMFFPFFPDFNVTNSSFRLCHFKSYKACFALP